MNSKPVFKRNLSSATLACAVFAGSALAGDAMSRQDLSAKNQDRSTNSAHNSQIDYRIGGVGNAEQQAMQQVRGQYPLSLTFVEMIGGHGAYTVGAQVEIRDRQGRTVLSTETDGPLMFVDLPDGEYTITARREGQTHERRVRIGGGTESVVFAWPGEQPLA